MTQAETPTQDSTPQSPDHARLLELAREVAARAYVPYSHFPVGAALLLDDGSVVTGCNVENASYGLAICAERGAVARLVAEGHGGARIVTAAVVGLQASPCYPCGACRQVLAEFACRTVVVEEDGQPVARDFATEVLPHSFGPHDLGA